jgi:hypothetical protein
MAEPLNSVVLLASLAGIVLVFYGPWQSFWVAWARQRIFEARANMFDIADVGQGISFESPQYQEIRSDLNAMIRFTHKFTWTRLLVHWLVCRATGTETRGSLVSTVMAIENDEVRFHVQRELTKIVRSIFIMMAYRSAPLLLVGIVLYLVSLCYKGLWRTGRPLFEYGLRVIGTEAQQIDRLDRRIAVR